MKAKKILFPTDFSRCGDAALKMATSLARDSGALLLIVHVEEPPVAYGGGEMYYGVPEPASDDLRQMLQEVVPTDPQVPCEHHLVTGDPSTAIARLAEEEHADLIVMGTHGRTGLTRLLMGSVAEAVVRHAPCPVLTYKQTAHSAETSEESSS
ncbi:MAG: universal stress protein [Pirellulaceae bacterium]